MNQPKISIIVSLAENRAIGKEDKLLFRISKDLKHFKSITVGHPIIMGRKTFESIGRPLPERTNIIITRNPDYKAEGCLVVHSFEEALEEAKKIDKEKIFVIGGGEIYKQALPIVNKLYLTVVDGKFEADTFFPDYSEFRKIIFEGNWETEGNYKFKFLELGR